MVYFNGLPFNGKINVPPSKSLTHRALICAALCKDGVSTVNNILICDDTLATVSCLRSMGADIIIDGYTATVRGFDITSARCQTDLFCGESGSTLRFLIPIAMLSGLDVTFKGGKRLFERPLDFYEKIAIGLGMHYELEDKSLTVCGPLPNGFYKVSCDETSQHVSGLLFALCSIKGYSVIELDGNPVSAHYINLTADTLKQFGAEISFSDNKIIINGKGLKPCNFNVEGDWSAAAPLFAMNALGSNIEISGLCRDSLQGDRIIRLLLGKIERSHIEMDVGNIPDIVPVIMATAPFFHGATLYGTDRLQLKESDRRHAMAEELAKFGFKVEVGNDITEIFEANEIKKPPEPLLSHGDHRIAMALSVPLSVSGGMLDGEGCVSKSFPNYFNILESVSTQPKVP